LSAQDSNKIRISIDAMGGNYAPGNEIKGVLSALEERGDYLELSLVGKETEIKKHLSNETSVYKDKLNIVNADEVVSMHDSPSDSFKNKQNNSMRIGLELQKSNLSDAFISAGNTGAVLAHSTLVLGRLEGISRPTIGAFLPSQSGFTLITDVGASVDCKPRHLFEFALMCSVYMKNIFNIDKPKIGLLNIGEEKSKGNELSFQAFGLLQNSKMNFIGNIEGSDVLNGKVDIAVCDGFTGNIVLKFAESVLDLLKFKFREYADKGFLKKIWIGMFRNTFKTILKDFDYQTHGGTLLLGINGVSIIGHGKSSPLAIKNMIFKAEDIVRKKINDLIKSELKNYI
jgi:glycerol-3-phosphate acyltransferase PlsX